MRTEIALIQRRNKGPDGPKDGTEGLFPEQGYTVWRMFYVGEYVYCATFPYHKIPTGILIDAGIFSHVENFLDHLENGLKFF